MYSENARIFNETLLKRNQYNISGYEDEDENEDEEGKVEILDWD